MNAAVSGRAGIALLVTDEGLFTLAVGEPELVVPRSSGELRHLLQDYADFEFLTDVELAEVRNALLRAWEANEGLDLALIALDAEMSRDVRGRALQELDELIAKGHVRGHLDHLLYAAPLPPGADIYGLLGTDAEHRSPRIHAWFSTLWDDQPEVARARAEFDRVAERAGEAAKEEVLAALAGAGAFFRAAKWLAGGAPREELAGLAEEVVSRRPELPEVARLTSRWVAALAELPVEPPRTASVTHATLQAEPDPFDVIVAISGPMRKVMAIVRLVARIDASVLISGESGTGKSLIARAIHAGSRRAAGPFVTINCAALPHSLLSTELFGHARGAFVGADHAGRGVLELASGGTIFLEEISEASLEVQAELVHVLQEGTVRPVGGRADIPIDLRLVAATSGDLVEAVRSGRLREDLYYRLSVVSIRVPPLRERRDDVPVLAEHFLRHSALALGHEAVRFSELALEVMVRYDWPGNVRELKYGVERLAILSPQHHEIAPEELPQQWRQPGADYAPGFSFPLLERTEREYIRRVLESGSPDLATVARTLGVSRSTLARLLERYQSLRREEI
jgi:DNA-binding NtrC family response regulator